MLVTTTFLLQLFHHFFRAKYKIVQITNERMNRAIGRTPDRNAFRKAGEGVNNVSSLFLTNQSKDTNGVEVDPILSAG